MSDNTKRKSYLPIVSMIMSIVAIGFAVLKITPFEITNDVFVGIIASFVGISVTLVIGYQIINTIEIKKEIAEQRKSADELKQLSDDLKSTIRKQQYEMQEGFDIIMTLQQHQENGREYSLNSFKSLHHALIHSLQFDREDFGWMFLLLRRYVSDINFQNFGYGFAKHDDKGFYCTSPNSPYYQKSLAEIINITTAEIYEDEKALRADHNFSRIKLEYDRVMVLFKKRINDLLQDPLKELSWEEKLAITDPDEFIKRHLE